MRLLLGLPVDNLEYIWILFYEMLYHFIPLCCGIKQLIAERVFSLKINEARN